MRLTLKSPGLRTLLTREAAYLLVLLFLGLVVMPMLIFQVGQFVFGEYGGIGYRDFFGTLSEKIRGGDPVAWFLVLSPYLVLQCLRLIRQAWRIFGDTDKR